VRAQPIGFQQPIGRPRRMRRHGGEMLIDHRDQRNRASCVVSDTADDDLMPVELVAVELFTRLKS